MRLVPLILKFKASLYGSPLEIIPQTEYNSIIKKMVICGEGF